MDWRARLAKAHAFLETAEECASRRDWDSAASRAYYAAFHAGVAFLEQLPGQKHKPLGEEWNEKELRSGLAQHFKHEVKGGRRLHQIVAALLADRIIADYHSGSVGRKRAGRDIRDSRMFMDEIVGFLKAMGRSLDAD